MLIHINEKEFYRNNCNEEEGINIIIDETDGKNQIRNSKSFLNCLGSHKIEKENNNWNFYQILEAIFLFISSLISSTNED